MTRRLAALFGGVSLLAAAGCASTVTPMPEVSEVAYNIACAEPTACRRKADRLCPDGWEEFEPGFDNRLIQGLGITYGELGVGLRDTLTFWNERTTDQMYVRCLDEDAPADAPDA